MTVRRGPPLPIEDAGDHTVGVMGREPAQQRDRVLVGADGGRPRARQSGVDLVERAARPARCEMGGRLVAIDLDCDVFDEGAQQLLDKRTSAMIRRYAGRRSTHLQPATPSRIALDAPDIPYALGETRLPRSVD